MSVALSQSVTFAIGHEDSDGNPSNASSIAGTLYRNGAATAETVTVTNLATGVYSVAFTVLAGWSVSDLLQVRIVADGIGRFVWGDVVDTTVNSRLPTASYTSPANSDIASIKARTDNLPSDPADQSAVETAIANSANSISALVNALNDISAADVNAQVLDVLQTDTFAELSAPPAATSSLKDKITWVFQWLRNKSTQTATQRKLYADDGTTVVSTETVSDDGTTFTKGEQS